MTLQFDVDKILLVKLETTFGTDPTPVGGNGFWAKDLKIMPMEGTDIDRGLDLPYFGSSGTIPVDLHSKITFDVELAPSGTSGTWQHIREQGGLSWQLRRLIGIGQKRKVLFFQSRNDSTEAIEIGIGSWGFNEV